MALSLPLSASSNRTQTVCRPVTPSSFVVWLTDFILVDFDRARVMVVTEMTNWPPKPIRRACVNSFGYGGANAHCILDHVISVVPGYQLRGLKKTINPGLNVSYNNRQNAEQNAVSGIISANDFLKHGHLINIIDDNNLDGLTSTNGSSKTNILTNGSSLSSTNSSTKTNGVTNANGFSNTNSNWKIHELCFGSIPEVVESTSPKTRSLVLLPFSSHDDFSLKANISVMAAAIKEHKLADLAYTLSTRRSRFFQRAFAVVESELPSAALTEDLMPCGKSTGSQVQRICFVFTGMLFDFEVRRMFFRGTNNPLIHRTGGTMG